MNNDGLISSFCVSCDEFNESYIRNLDNSITCLRILGEYKLTKHDYDNLVVYTNVNVLYVYDVCDFLYGNDIEINISKSVCFNSPRFNKFNINKVFGYNKKNITLNLPFKLYFSDDCLYNEEDDFNKLLNYINDIEILNVNFDGVDVVDKVIEVICKIEDKIGKKIKFINCVTPNRTISDIEKLCFFEDGRIIKVWYEDGITDCSISEFILMRKELDLIINDVKNKCLSNFEKVIYVYDIVKKFNYNSSSDNYSMDGRQLHKIFGTNKIVCSGYSRIITQVLNELGIRSGIYKLITKNNVLHARSLVHIVDDIYGINSIFSMEPTWESALNEQYAYSMFLTPINKLKEYFPFDKFREDIDVLCGFKKIDDINLKDRISLYQFFDNKDLSQNEIDDFLVNCNKVVDLDVFCKALINVRCAQGVNKTSIVSNVSNIVAYNSRLVNYLNENLGTNINFFS